MSRLLLSYLVPRLITPHGDYANAQYFAEIALGTPPQSVSPRFAVNVDSGLLTTSSHSAVQGNLGHWVLQPLGPWQGLYIHRVLLPPKVSPPRVEMYIFTSLTRLEFQV